MKIKKIKIIIFLTFAVGIPFFLPEVSSAAGWYVDNSIPSSGNGQSWTTAWKNFSNINWTVVQPGDIVWVSGGTYIEDINLSKSGTSDNRIIIKASKESGHNELVSIVGKVSLTGSWVDLDGARSDNFLDNPLYVNNVDLIKENINIDIKNPMGPGIFIPTGSSGHRIKWINAHDSGIANIGFWQNHGMSIFFNSDNANIEVAYCHIFKNYADGINVAPDYQNPGIGIVKIHHVIIDDIADDGIQTGGATDISYSKIGGQHPTHSQGHPDLIQFYGRGGVRVYNNLLIMKYSAQYGDLNSAVYFETKNETGASYHMLVYGNVAYTTDINPPYVFSFGPQYKAGDPSTGAWNQLVIANNTSIRGHTAGILVEGEAPYQTITISSGYAVNNLIFDAGQGAGIDNTDAFSARGGSELLVYDANTFKVENNVISGRTDDVLYNGTRYESPELMSSATGLRSNSSALPAFRNFFSYDFQLAGSDLAARNRGMSLRSYLPLSVLALMPDYDKDMNGNIRGQEGVWDIGAFEYAGEAGEDNIPPSVTINQPLTGSTVSGQSVTVTSNASDNIGVIGIQFKLDGADLGFEDTSYPYSVTWNTIQVANGSHILTATARDAAGNQATSEGVAVNVNNNQLDENLLLYYDFEDDFTRGTLIDRSSYGGNADCQLSFYPNNDTNNGLTVADQCPGIGTSHNGSQAAEFSGSTCLLESDYFSIPNPDGLTSLAEGTVSAWVNYNSPDDSNYLVPNTSFSSQRVLDARLQGVINSWALWKNYGSATQLTLNRLGENKESEMTLLSFPDSGVTNSWNHYAFTWDTQIAKSYYNGALVQEVSKADVPYFAFSNYIAMGALKHNPARNSITNNCVNYYQATLNYYRDNNYPGYSDPLNKTYVMPNAGYLNGKIDEVRIYDRTLSQSEVESVKNGLNFPSDRMPPSTPGNLVVN